MSAKPKIIREDIDGKQKATLDHANALLMALHDMSLEIVGSSCTCATCQTLRRNAVHVRALFSTAQKVKA